MVTPQDITIRVGERESVTLLSWLAKVHIPASSGKVVGRFPPPALRQRPVQEQTGPFTGFRAVAPCSDKQNNSKIYYDQHCKELPELNVGDDVIMLENNNKKIRGTVLGKAATPRSYIVKNRIGIYRRNRRHLIQNLAQNSKQAESQKQSPSSIVTSDDTYESEEEGEEYEPSRELGESFECSPPCLRPSTKF
ncbi:hypothetical protein OBRU01_03615 [Operophtera brumata]|uniref:Uncharacterized protein n=1 Tax=Operophtera brumata TaxID=104452 RepID=A0A0L7LQR4_OPEBR|nr:hypothetical protein OBRU01_03615 [Operophtera brumata]